MHHRLEYIGRATMLAALSLKGIWLLELTQVNSVLNAMLTAVSVLYISAKIYMEISAYRKGESKASLQ